MEWSPKEFFQHTKSVCCEVFLRPTSVLELQVTLQQGKALCSKALWLHARVLHLVVLNFDFFLVQL
jgi:hypothetical protein